MDFKILGRTVMILGVFLFAIGLLLSVGNSFFENFKGLPGDIIIKRKNFTFYFPVVSSILLSLILSTFFWFIHKK